MRTTSMLLDNDILIDAGTGVGGLSVEQLSSIDHVFVTHSHLDHVAMIPFLVDTVGCLRSKPITVHATQATLEIIRQNIFNWKIWPDFTQIPSPEEPYLRYQSIFVGKTVELKGRKITPLPANHTVPAVGFHLNSGKGSLVFTGDTTSNDELWEAVNKVENLRYLIIETAFCNREQNMATASKHLCPSMLAEELAKLQRPARIYVTHLMPSEIELIMQEVEECAGSYLPKMLRNDQVFKF